MRNMQNPVENPGYLDVSVLQNLRAFIAPLKERITALLRVSPADRVIDVGCGPGIDTVPMAGLVGEDGLIVGIDYDEDMVVEANHRAREAGVEARVVHGKADAHHIPCPSDYFDACRSERLLQHVADAESVLGEMARVTKSGGRMVVADTDWGTLSIDSPDIEIEREIVRFRAGIYHNGYAGRQLFRLMKEQHMRDVRVEIHPVIWTDYSIFRATSFCLNDFERKLMQSRTVSEPQLLRFLSGLRDADRRGVFFACANMIVVAGVKP